LDSRADAGEGLGVARIESGFDHRSGNRRAGDQYGEYKGLAGRRHSGHAESGSAPEPAYRSELLGCAMEGINSWKFLQKEGLCTFEMVDNPDEADIYVFWTNHFVNKLGLALFENDIRGYTAKYLLPTSAVMQAIARNDLEMVRRSRKPVVILLRTAESDGSPIILPKMKASAAHEFGHALGIDGHSPFPTDLMSVYYGRGVVSANDAATMRFLYKHPADLMP
jgi:predicted Zn-dependent protease